MANQNTVYLTGTPAHTDGNFYDMNGIPVYSAQPLPKELITVIGRIYSDEAEEELTCQECGKQFPMLFNVSYVLVNSFYAFRVPMEENAVADELYNSVILLGRINSYSAMDGLSREGAARTYYQARINVLSENKFDYITCNSRDFFSAEKNEPVSVTGRLRAKQYLKKCTCPYCKTQFREPNTSMHVEVKEIQCNRQKR